MMSENILCVIPARGGSKRVPNKNLREVGDKPLIAHAIKQANKSKMIDRSIVSTENDKIKEVARSYGGKVPFDRPNVLATDTAKNNDVITHALNWFEDRNEKYDIIIMLQTTTPFCASEDIDLALDKLVDSEANSIISISKFDVPPVWAVTESETGYLEPYSEEEYLWTDEIPRSQDTPTLYHPNGAIFASHVSEFKKRRSFYTKRTLGYKMPRSRSLDIDDPFDLELARALIDHRS